MPVIICLLRGVNVVGRHQVSMSALRDLCGSIGLPESRTWLQSGNLLFKTKERSLPGLKKRLEGCFEETFGFHSEIVLRTTADLRQIIARNPFHGRPDVEPSKLIVTFLRDHPRASAWEEIVALKIQPEELQLHGRELFIYFPRGQGQSKLPFTKVDKILGTLGTARNWNTITKLLKLAEEMENSRKLPTK